MGGFEAEYGATERVVDEVEEVPKIRRSIVKSESEGGDETTSRRGRQGLPLDYYYSL